MAMMGSVVTQGVGPQRSEEPTFFEIPSVLKHKQNRSFRVSTFNTEMDVDNIWHREIEDFTGIRQKVTNTRKTLFNWR